MVRLLLPQKEACPPCGPQPSKSWTSFARYASGCARRPATSALRRCKHHIDVAGVADRLGRWLWWRRVGPAEVHDEGRSRTVAGERLRRLAPCAIEQSHGGADLLALIGECGDEGGDGGGRVLAGKSLGDATNRRSIVGTS